MILFFMIFIKILDFFFEIKNIILKEKKRKQKLFISSLLTSYVYLK